jgi:hypothetical protein
LLERITADRKVSGWLRRGVARSPWNVPSTPELTDGLSLFTNGAPACAAPVASLIHRLAAPRFLERAAKSGVSLADAVYHARICSRDRRSITAFIPSPKARYSVTFRPIAK